MYREEEYLQLSGIQHFLFCRRQWAMIHIEQQWEENTRTIDGAIMHRKAHESGSHTRRGDVLTVRAMRIHSHRMGVSGECDVVEFLSSEDGISLNGSSGKWKPFPIEYKRGSPKLHKADEAQLCAQAMCLEEMLCCDIHEGALFYGENRRRKTVEFTDELRDIVKNAFKEMHQYFSKGYTPKVRPSKSCNSCSLYHVCVPELMNRLSVSDYLQKSLESEE